MATSATTSSEVRSVYSVIAAWIPVTVVPMSAATCRIETFMTELSRVMRNWPEARTASTNPLPAAAAPARAAAACPPPGPGAAPERDVLVMVSPFRRACKGYGVTL
jgi:hypothetical protein